MTTFPVCEQIAQVFEARLARVKKANGFQVDAVGVVRPKTLGGYTPVDRLIVLYQGDEVKDTNNSLPAEAIVWNQPFFAMLFTKPSNRDQAPVEQLINLFKADVMRAFCTNAAGDFEWWVLGDNGSPLAIQAWLGDPLSIATRDGQLEGCIVPCNVRYAVSLTDPYTVYTTD